MLNRDVPIVHSDFNLEDMKYKCKMCGSTRDNTLACDWVKLHSYVASYYICDIVSYSI